MKQPETLFAFGGKYPVKVKKRILERDHMNIILFLRDARKLAKFFVSKDGMSQQPNANRKCLLSFICTKGYVLCLDNFIYR